MYRYIITLLTLCCFVLPSRADEIQLQTNAPERYVVNKGDTLWGISSKFLKDPWQWPKVWKMNRQEIKNPHWIYPGDVVVLDKSSGTPQLKLLHETVVLNPSAKEEALEKDAIKTIQPNVIAPFLTQPLIVDAKEIEASPEIIGGQDNRVVLSQGTKVYVSKIDEGSNRLWSVYREGEVLLDPDTRQPLGLEAIYLGDAKITKYGAPASAEVVRAKEEIFIKDKLIPLSEKAVLNYTPHAPETDITAKVIKIYGGVAETGRGNIIVISRGKADGIEDGHVLAIMHTGPFTENPNAPKTEGFWNKAKEAFSPSNPKKRLPNDSKSIPKVTQEELDAQNPKLLKLPDERVGLVMIFRTFDKVSYGLVMQSTEPIKLLDTVKTPN